MGLGELKKILIERAKSYAKSKDLKFKSALIFKNIQDNFHPESFEQIQKKDEWKERLNKSHPDNKLEKGTKEMQSSNSSDALLMSVFCHPEIVKWEGIRNLFDDDFSTIEFGFKAKVSKKDSHNNESGDRTEIDLKLTNTFNILGGHKFLERKIGGS